MGQLWSFEFQKIVGRKLIRVGLLAYGVLILIILSNSRVDFLDIFDQNGRHLHGKEALEQAMLNEPEILILDEPTAGLDPKERVRFRNLISSFSKDKIVLLSTHIVSDVEYIADKIFLMKEGQILKEGTPEEITAQMNGLVWECEVDEKRAAELEYRYTIVNMKKKNGAIELRIVSDTKPDEAAISVDAALEDMYLYYFKEDGNEAIMEF